jgi:hypothetical protein
MDLAVSALPRAPGAVPGKDPAVTGPDRTGLAHASRESPGSIETSVALNVDDGLSGGSMVRL